MDLKKHIRSIVDYPKKGILFRDITTLIKNPTAFRYTNDRIIEISKNMKFESGKMRIGKNPESFKLIFVRVFIDEIRNN